jgi:hypothetical protein
MEDFDIHSKTSNIEQPVYSSTEKSGHDWPELKFKAKQERKSTIDSKRRAQNRASQLAYRSRQAKYVENLEGKVKELSEKYENLEKTYSDLKASHDMLKEELTRTDTGDEIVGPSVGPSVDIRFDWGSGPLDIEIRSRESPNRLKGGMREGNSS